MTRTMTDDIVQVNQFLVDMLRDNMLSLRLEEVFFGDTDKISRWPSVCIEPGSVDSSELAGAPLRVLNNITVYVLIYHGALGQGMERTKKECLQVAENVKTYINSNHNLDGLVVQGWCTSLDPGYLRKGNFLSYVTRITWSGLSQTLVLPTTG